MRHQNIAPEIIQHISTLIQNNYNLHDFQSTFDKEPPPGRIDIKPIENAGMDATSLLVTSTKNGRKYFCKAFVGIEKSKYEFLHFSYLCYVTLTEIFKKFICENEDGPFSFKHIRLVNVIPPIQSVHMNSPICFERDQSTNLYTVLVMFEHIHGETLGNKWKRNEQQDVEFAKFIAFLHTHTNLILYQVCVKLWSDFKKKENQTQNSCLSFQSQKQMVEYICSHIVTKKQKTNRIYFIQDFVRDFEDKRNQTHTVGNQLNSLFKDEMLIQNPICKKLKTLVHDESLEHDKHSYKHKSDVGIKHFKSISEILKKRYDTFFTDEIEKEIEKSTLVLTHTDLHPFNMMFDNNQTKLYIIDWDYMKLAPPEYDLIFFDHKDGEFNKKLKIYIDYFNRYMSKYDGINSNTNPPNLCVKFYPEAISYFYHWRTFDDLNDFILRTVDYIQGKNKDGDNIEFYLLEIQNFMKSLESMNIKDYQLKCYKELKLLPTNTPFL